MPAKVKGTLVSNAYDRIKANIRTGLLPAGSRTPEPEIASALNMSRTPVREALIRLQAEGLITLIPRHGALVLPVGRQDLVEIYEILAVLEPEAAARIAQHGLSDAERATLQQHLEAMQMALDGGNLGDWCTADDLFHTCLLELQGNRRLQLRAAPLLDQLHRVLDATLQQRSHLERATREHHDLLAALNQGDASAARRAMRQHRKREEREILEILETHDQQQF